MARRSALENPDVSQENTSFLRRNGFLLIVTLLLALILSNVTYAWVSRNHDVGVKSVKMSYDVNSLQVGGVQIEGDIVSLIDPGTTSSYSTGDENLIPGSVLTMRIGLANSGTTAQTVTSLGFQDVAIWKSSDGGYSTLNKDDYDEIPTLYEGDYYYLGTQLTISVNRYAIYEYKMQAVLDGEGMQQYDDAGEPIYQMVIVKQVSSTTMTTMTPVYMTNVSSTGAVTVTQTIRDDLNVELAANHLIAFDVVVTFVNDTENEQNAYRDFGSTSLKAKFSRTLAINVAD